LLIWAHRATGSTTIGNSN